MPHTVTRFFFFFFSEIVSSFVLNSAERVSTKTSKQFEIGGFILVKRERNSLRCTCSDGLAGAFHQPW